MSLDKLPGKPFIRSLLMGDDGLAIPSDRAA